MVKLVYKYKNLILSDRRLRRKLKNLSLTFTRSGVAYDYQGNSVPENTPRFTHLINGVIQKGILIEEAHTNLLTANQSTCTDTVGDTTGFVAFGSGASISSSTAEYKQGNKSIKCITTGNAVSEGIVVNSTTVAASTVHTFTGWFKADAGVVLALHADGWNEVMTLTGNGDWQQFYYSKTTGGLTSIPFRIYTKTQQATTFYVDMLSLYQLPYSLSWTLGGTTSNAETLTAPSSVLNIDTNGYSNLLSPNQASFETDTTGWGARTNSSIARTTEQYHQGSACLAVTTNGVGESEGASTVGAPTTVVAGTYSLGCWIKAPVGALLRVTISDGDGNNYASITGDGNWNYYTVTRTTTKTSLYVTVFTYPGAQATTFYIDELILSATSGVKPWIPGGTQSSNTQLTIEMEAYLDSKYFLINQTSGSLRFLMYASATGNRISIGNYTNSATARIAGQYQNGSSLRETNALIATLSQGFTNLCLRLGEETNVQKWNVGSLSGVATYKELPSSITQFMIGASKDQTAQANTIIRNVTISLPKRSDTDTSNRSSQNVNGVGFKVDKEIKLVAPLKNNLSAYRVRG